MMNYFQTLKSLSIVSRKVPEDNIYDLLRSGKYKHTSTKNLPKISFKPNPPKCRFIPLDVKIPQNNFLKKKKIYTKEVQSEQLLSNQYAVATHHFGEAFTPFFAEMIPEVNLFI